MSVFIAFPRIRQNGSMLVVAVAHCINARGAKVSFVPCPPVTLNFPFRGDRPDLTHLGANGRGTG